ncbi:MAG: glycosyltransferase family 2 protein [Nodosilinea sp.]
MIKPTIICLTPVKNERWILDRFLRCASLWADYIIVADQNSDDGSREIALRHEKVTLIENRSNNFNQGVQQKLLIDAAREIPEPRILIALDADEMLTANVMNHPEWKTLLNAPPGTIGELQWVNILPNFKSYWWDSKCDFHYPVIFVDDGSDYIGNMIHCSRIPEPSFASRIRLKSIKLLHYSYAEWKRNESKQRWYQCWEKINRPSQSSVRLCRSYNSALIFPSDEIFSLKQEWFTNYEEKDIDMTSVYQEGIYWRDKQILQWMAEHGSAKFNKLAIWDFDWSALAIKLNVSDCGDGYKDSRGWPEKLLHVWLKKTQPFRKKLVIRITDKILEIFF